MKYATKMQILEAARCYGPVGRDSVRGMYSLSPAGDKIYFGCKLYLNSLHNLAREGKLVSTGEWTYAAR